MSRNLEINTSFAVIASAGERLSALAEEFVARSEKTRERLQELMDDPTTYGNDKPGEQMKANKPDLESLYEARRNFGIQGEQIGLNIRTVMALMEEAELESQEDIGEVEA